MRDRKSKLLCAVKFVRMYSCQFAACFSMEENETDETVCQRSRQLWRRSEWERVDRPLNKLSLSELLVLFLSFVRYTKLNYFGNVPKYLIEFLKKIVVFQILRQPESILFLICVSSEITSLECLRAFLKVSQLLFRMFNDFKYKAFILPKRFYVSLASSVGIHQQPVSSKHPWKNYINMIYLIISCRLFILTTGL